MGAANKSGRFQGEFRPAELQPILQKTQPSLKTLHTDLFLESERSTYEKKIPDISLINQCDWSTQAKRLSLSSIYI